MPVEERRRPAVGRQVRHWRSERGLTLAAVAERSGLNVGTCPRSRTTRRRRLSPVSLRWATRWRSPSPGSWSTRSAAPQVVRASERSVTKGPGRSRIERVDGGSSRDLSIVEATLGPGERTGPHTHAGDEHHVIVAAAGA